MFMNNPLTSSLNLNCPFISIGYLIIFNFIKYNKCSLTYLRGAERSEVELFRGRFNRNESFRINFHSLSQNLLKGEKLTTFIKRSFEMIK
jgi:hypothetical protein